MMISKIKKCLREVCKIQTGKTALENAGVEIGESDVRIVAETYLNINVNSCTESTLEVDISAAYHLLATTAANDTDINKDDDGEKNAVVLENTEHNLRVNSAITLWVGLPAGFTEEDSMLVRHIKNGKSHFHKASINEENGTLIATFVSNDGLSPFVFSAANEAEASIAGTYYATLAEAVDVAQDGDIIQLEKDIELIYNIAVSRVVEFRLDTNGCQITGNGKIVAGSGYELAEPSADDDGYMVYTVTKSSTTPWVPQPSVAVNTESTTNGSFTVSNRYASTGSTVTVTPKPSEGYEVDTVTVTDWRGNDVEVKANEDGTYSFVMPGISSQPVTVKVTFKEIVPVHVCPSEKFTDVDQKEWYHEGVDYAIEHNLMGGISDSLFAPDGIATRAQIVTILYNLEGRPTVDEDSEFEDVPAGMWYSAPISWAAANNVVGGYGNGNFGPEDTITREQMAVILYQYAIYKGYDVTNLSDLTSYTDTDAVSNWALNAIRWAVGDGIIGGTSPTTLSPGGDSTRSQVATVFMHFCENVVK